MKTSNFNDNWKFWNEKKSFSLVWDVPTEAQDVTLPHDGMVSQKPRGESPNGGRTGYRDGNNLVYVKSFFASREQRDRMLMLRFDGVYMNASVYVNQQLAAKCPNGYSPFLVELNGFLRYGEENEIRVLVKNGTMNNSRWYSGEGIYRDVQLLESGLIHIAPDGVRIGTESLDERHALISVAAELRNRHHQGDNLILETRVVDNEGRTAAVDETKLYLPKGRARVMTVRMGLEDPHLWDADDPCLYRCLTTLRRGEEVIDESETSFGVRLVQADRKHGLRINRKTVKLRGACIHHDSGVLGAATYFDAQYRQIKRLKAAGFNAVRMAHHTMAPAMLRACDELGVYVMDEAFDMWTRCKSDFDYGMNFNEFWESDVEAMVAKDFNHPSVIMYSIGNEIPEIGTDHGSVLAHDISEKIKSLDGTRLTLAGINGPFAAGDEMERITRDIFKDLGSEGAPKGDVNEFMSLMRSHMDRILRHPILTERLEKACAATDLAGYNYMVCRYEKDGEDYPNRLIVGSENFPPKIARNWAMVERLDHVLGDFTWTGWDYIGEAGIGIPGYGPGEGGFGAVFPAQLAYCGDFDLCGFRRPLSYYREIVFGFRSDPFMAVQNPRRSGREMTGTPWVLSDGISSWNWPGCEGTPVTVEVYSPGDEVELILNGVSLGKKPAGAGVEFRILFETEYRGGKLEAVCYREGQVAGRTELVTPGENRSLVSRIEYGKENELVFVELALVDENRVLADDEAGELRISVGGDFKLLGFGTGNPSPLDNYDGPVTRLFRGRALAVLSRRGGKGEGFLKLTMGDSMELEVPLSGMDPADL